MKTKFRWMIEKRHVTAEMVKKYSRENGVPMSEAKKILVQEKEPILQYRTWYGKWRDVPYITEYKE